ncbi:MAG: methyltransferase domain-containing protein [Candidatus Hodarchaeales archaeon]|jgi:SAM-dependent methyltransferase
MTNKEESADVFGQLLLDHHTQQKPVYYVIERDDGLINVDISTGYFSKYDDWQKKEQFIIDQAISPVLDLGCGAGRHSLYLQNKDFEVVALDLSLGALDVAKQRGIKNTVHGDIKDLPSFDLKFGTFLFMGNNFALCGDPETSKKVLKNLAEIATPNTKIIAHFRDPSPDDPALDPVHREYHDNNRKKGLPVGQVKIRILYRKLRTPWFPFYIPTSEELTRIIENSGSWRIETLIQKEQFLFTVIKRV